VQRLGDALADVQAQVVGHIAQPRFEAETTEADDVVVDAAGEIVDAPDRADPDLGLRVGLRTWWSRSLAQKEKAEVRDAPCARGGRG
jgi:hypothetical protein